MVPTGRLDVLTSGGADRLSIAPPKVSLTPTASQLTGLEHEMPNSEPTPAGAGLEVQFDPPSVVVTMLVPPTAVQALTFMQLMPDSDVAPAGVPRSDQRA